MKPPWYLHSNAQGTVLTPRPIYLLWLRAMVTLRLWCTARTERWPVNSLSEYRWFRRWIGGHWERWYLDVVHSEFWFRCQHGAVERPSAICRGTPTCEEYP